VRLLHARCETVRWFVSTLCWYTDELYRSKQQASSFTICYLLYALDLLPSPIIVW